MNREEGNVQDKTTSVTNALEQRSVGFRRRFLMMASGTLVAIGVMGLIVYSVSGGDARSLVSIAVTASGCAGALALALAGQTDWSARALLSAIVAGAAPTLWVRVDDPFAIGSIETLFIVAMLAPFLLPRAWTVGVIVGAQLVVLIAYGRAVAFGEMSVADAGPASTGTAMLLAGVGVIVHFFARHADENLAILRARLHDIEIVMHRAQLVAKGDLSGEIHGDGEAPATVRAMLEALRDVVKRIQETSTELASATQEIAAMTRQQEESAVEQASAVEETRRTIEALVASSREIASSARGVAENAETTLTSSRTIDERLATLAQHTDRIAEILDVIKDVANKSELLALNAALEGAKAGEAGRGFSLVAARMQRLAEDVMTSVRDVKSLTDDIRGATRATTTATASATRLAEGTTQAAYRISAVTRDQERSTEEVTRAMNDIATATTQSTAGTNQTLRAAKDLEALAERLNGLVARFQL